MRVLAEVTSRHVRTREAVRRKTPLPKRNLTERMRDVQILKAAQGLENLKSSIARDNIRAIESLLSCNTIARTKITNLSAREDGTGAARGTTSEQPRENDDATVPHERSVFAPTTMAVDVDQREGALQAKPTAGAWTENSNVGSEQGKMSPLPRVIKAITVQNPSGRDRQTSTSTPKSNETPDTKVADINEVTTILESNVQECDCKCSPSQFLRRWLQRNKFLHDRYK